MSKNIGPAAAPAAPAPVATRSKERVAWWIVFAILTLSLVVMLGAWN